MAIVIPILTNYSDRGMKQAFRDVQRADNKFRAFGTASKAAFGAAGIAAGLFAVKLGTDAVKAAIDEEAELARLSQTLTTLGFGAASDDVNAFIDDLRFATGVADSELRPAMDTLVRATDNVIRAQDLLSLAVDISAQKQIALSSVVNALAKAEDGSATALGKLNLGIDKNVIKGQEATVTFKQLADLYGGAAATQADTLQGKIARLSDGFSELQESLGTGLMKGFIAAVADGQGGLDDFAQTLRDLGPQLEAIGEDTGQFLGDLLEMIGGLAQAKDAVTDLAGSDNFGLQLLGVTFDSLTRASIPQIISGLDLLIDYFFDTGNAATTAAGQIRDFQGAQAGGGGGGGSSWLPNPARPVPQLQYASDNPYNVNPTGLPVTILSSFTNAMNEATAAVDKGVAAVHDFGGAAGGGGAAAAVDKLTAAQKKAIKKFAALVDSVELSKTALASVAESVEEARKKIADYSDTTREWLLSGVSLASVYSEYSERIAQATDLDTQIAAAIAAGDSEGQARLTAERAGINTANSWWEGFQKQIADSRAAQTSMTALVATLNPADTLGNELLLDQLRELDPATAAAAMNDLVTRGLGPAAAAALSSVFGEAGTVGTTIATAFYGSGLTAAEAQYQAIKTKLESKLAALHKLGKDMGDAVADGWNSAIANLPADVRLPGGAGGTVNNVTVNAGVGDPVAIARTVADVIAQAARRTR